VAVTLPSRFSWPRSSQAGVRIPCSAVPQDHFRKSRKPSYTNVFHDRGGVVGVVEFETKEDLKAAIHDLDGEFSSVSLVATCVRGPEGHDLRPGQQIEMAGSGGRFCMKMCAVNSCSCARQARHPSSQPHAWRPALILLLAVGADTEFKNPFNKVCAAGHRQPPCTSSAPCAAVLHVLLSSCSSRGSANRVSRLGSSPRSATSGW
jgi:hypothetical protein